MLNQLNIEINSSRDAFHIQLYKQTIDIKKDASSLKWAKMICPYLEKSQSTQDKIQSLTEEQYYYSRQQISLIKELKTLSQETSDPNVHVLLTDILEFAYDYHFFTQDIYKLYNKELPND